jgi:rhamnose transport system ATP-binding protein
MTAPVLELANVFKSFGAVTALNGVSFDLRAGEVHALLGENGAGKSTLIKIITGAHQADRGEIRIDGYTVHRMTPASARAAGIAAIYQQPALCPDLSVAENIGLFLEKPSWHRRVRWRDRNQRAAELLKRVGAEIAPEVEARNLSMPEQQLVGIARALGAGARVLIMDEPTASLTAKEVELLLGLILALRAEGVGIIYITHRLQEIFQIADRVTVLRDGVSITTRRVELGNPGARALNPGVKHVVPAFREKPITESELIHLMVGREVSTIFPPPEGVAGYPMLQLRGLGCRAAGVHNVNLEVRAGEILGLAGLVGAGRTELARVIFGLTPADSGSMVLDSKPLAIRSPREAADAGIGYVPEDRRQHGVILEMEIGANTTLAIHSSIFPTTWLRLAGERQLALKFIHDLGIKAPSAETRVGNLSGGNQQKVALSRWLASKPKLLILDEPTQGVDIGAKAEIHKLIRRLASHGMAVLMISSELPEILGMSDRIAVMREGTVAVQFPRNANPRDIMAAALGKKKG